MSSLKYLHRYMIRCCEYIFTIPFYLQVFIFFIVQVDESRGGYSTIGVGGQVDVPQMIPATSPVQCQSSALQPKKYDSLIASFIRDSLS